MNRDLEDIIRYEHENTFVDFKREEYTKPKFHSFIKDVVAMANANVDGSRYIIIGVDLSYGGRDMVGISGPLTDSAIYQNLLHQKVEPEIHLKYYPYQIDEVTLGIFEIRDCNDQPYMLKNELQPLKPGDCYIRKGSTQLPFMRSDLDKIMAKKMQSKGFKGDVQILFQESGKNELYVKHASGFQLPSERAAAEIQNELTRKNHDRFNQVEGLMMGSFTRSMREMGRYSNMPEKELREKLRTVKQDYEKHDRYYLHETKAKKINFMIKSLGEEYIEDSTIKILIDKQPGLYIAFGECVRPGNELFDFKHRDDPDYPEVKEDGNQYCVQVDLPSIKHLIAISLFQVDLRITFLKDLSGKSVPLKFEVAGKNLAAPIIKHLAILVE